MSAERVAITGNTYPVRRDLYNLGGRWDAEKKAWMVPADKAERARKLVREAPLAPKGPRPPNRCRVCNVQASRYMRINQEGECWDCYEERKMSY